MLHEAWENLSKLNLRALEYFFRRKLLRDELLIVRLVKQPKGVLFVKLCQVLQCQCHVLTLVVFSDEALLRSW